MHSIAVRQAYTLQSIPHAPHISRTHLAPYIVIMILLSVFPMLCFTFHDYQCVRSAFSSEGTVNATLGGTLPECAKIQHHIMARRVTFTQHCATWHHTFSMEL